MDTVLKTFFVLQTLIIITAGVSLRHEHSKSTSKKRFMHRRELDNGARYPSLSFLKYETQNNSVVVAQVGGSALLKCFTENLGEELVTWLKRDDEQLLTAGPQVYSSENRYSVSHIKHQKLWELKIRDVQSSDAGSYECQLTTHPPISIIMTLKVVEARAVIRGRKELHVHEGSRLRLVCYVEEATEPPLFVFWYHNGSMVNYEPHRPSLAVTNQHFGSILTISNVAPTDAGAYRCEPSNAKADNITLHVVADENSAAMQRGVDNKNNKVREQNGSSVNTAKATQSNSAKASSSSASSERLRSSKSNNNVVLLFIIQLFLYFNSSFNVKLCYNYYYSCIYSVIHYLMSIVCYFFKISQSFFSNGKKCLRNVLNKMYCRYLTKPIIPISSS